MTVWIKRALLIAAGAAGGYAYYFFIGCYGGTCPITSNPYISTAYGSVVGLLLGWNTSKPGRRETDHRN